MTLIVYSVIYSLIDDIFASDIDNVYSTAESAIENAKKIGAMGTCYEVHVDKERVDENGRSFLSTIYKENHNERYLEM